MSIARSAKAERIFFGTIDLGPEERAAFIRSECAGDPELQKEVEALVQEADASDSYFENLPERLGINRLRSGEDHGEFQAGAGQQFGKYRLTSLLGSGGMGAVWRAERSDGRFEGEVAVKLLTRTGNAAALRRFEREANYLAKLTHAGIARLIDAGVGPSDVPYLILDYVEGVSIDRYSDTNSLSTDERLGLFLKVLDAVAHAHTHLIVHSDIKPSNVLVTPDGSVKLLDFGIASLLSDDESLESGRALTPEYAAPEQLSGGGITTATDVYSLGLLLYVLLAGQSPRASAQVTSIDQLRAVAMREPPSLASTGAESEVMSLTHLRQLAAARGESAGRLLKTLRGELDNIVRKALAVEPGNRYLTVNDFATDIRRYLRNEPVSARPDSINYRAKKFVQRHRGGVLTAMLTVVALLAAATITSWQSIEAARQRDIAIRQQERVLASNDFLNMLLGELGPGGEKMSLQELLDRGVKVIDEQYGTNERTTGMTLYDVSILYGRLGQIETQISLLDRSEAIGRNVNEDKLVANALCAKSRLKVDSDASASAADLKAGLAIRDRLPRSDRSGIIECYRAAALAQSTAGDHDGAIATYRSAINVLDEAPVSSPSLRLLLLNDLAEQYFITDRAAEALGILDEVIAYDKELGRERTVEHVIYLVNRSAVLSRFGEVLQASIGQQEAMQRVQGMDRAPVAIGGHYGNSLLRLARYDEAIALLEAEYGPAVAAGHKRWQGQLALLIATALIRSDRIDEAEAKLDIAEAIFAEAPGSFPRHMVAARLSRAAILQAKGHVESAVEAVTDVLDELGYPAKKDAQGLSSALWNAANIALASGDASAALQYSSDELDLVAAVARDPDLSADVGQALHQRGRSQHMLGDNAAAAVDLQNAVISLSNGFGDDHPETVAARERLAQLSD